MSAADQAKWQRMPLLAYDVESTGVSVWEDRIVTACMVVFEPGQRPRAFNWIVDPGIPIPEGAAEIHGWTTERVQAHPDVRTPEEALFEITGRLALWMGRRFPVVAMNAPYDFTMTEVENRRHGVATLAERLAPAPVGPIIDPMVVDRKVDRYRKGGRKLVDLCAHYGVPLVAAHSAESDAASTVRLARAIIARHPEAFRGMTIGGLHQAQQQWRAEQMNGLREYFDRQGTAHDGCCGSWPVHTEKCCGPKPPVAPPIEEAQSA